ncbi:imelysin family protein [Flavobacterium sp. UMI-01]|uniref:imelysin family protein n=1 Tax=Flavobacterium sp. UMI-01 TaxID=1441053 RepID=UPI001C7DC97D|nr:imelysin family protein [Flavobacterium sp. UMI-01]GIZ08425.1 iron-regulated protein A precursor [Flavobacterium sp. UMI-01]
MKKIFFLFSLSLIAVAVACSSSDGGNDSSDGFDRTALLTHWANNIILPSYTNYQTKLQVVVTSSTTFTTTPTEANLQTLRSAWLEAYKAYQYVSQYSSEKTDNIYFREKANTYPTDASAINANITTGTYNFSLISQFSKQGFPALDYVLNGLGNTDAEIVALYTGPNAAKYKKYLTDLVSTLKADADTIVTDWNSTYKTTYIANNGNTVTSSVNTTVNLFIKHFEKDIRAGKLGIPAGVFSGGTLYVDKVEAYYKKDVSKILLTTALQASKDFFNGKNFDNTSTGPSLKSYLDYLNAVRSGQNLSTVINNQFDLAFTKINALEANLSNQITTDKIKILDAYDALQQNVVYLKLDMMQALKITVDYVDNDGD